MAVIDRKKLLQQFPDWRKLSASARALLSAYERFTNKDGAGNPSWSNLMYYSGIVGKDTFKKARQQLIDIGMLSLIKSWRVVEMNGKKIPQANIDYQITKSILWDKSPSHQSNSSTNSDLQSMKLESMDSRKEGDSHLGVSNKGVIKIQPTAVNEPIKERENKVRGIPTSVGETLVSGYSGLVGHSGSFENKFVPRHEWQVEAERLAKYVGISNPSKSWFKFFRDSFAKNRKFLLQRAATSMVDAPNIRDKERYFFGLVGKFLEE